MNLKSTFLFAFICAVCTVANAQIINNGALKVEAGTVVYFQNEYTNAPTGNHVSNGLFYLNSNFINNGTTGSEAGTTYFKSAVNKQLSLTGASKSANFYNLEVAVTGLDKKGVLVADDFSLEVANAVNLVSGDLRLTGNAQLIQKHTGVSPNAGSGKLLRDQWGHSSSFKYNYWSSPVNNNGSFSLSGGGFDGADALKNPFAPQQILFQSGKPYNGLPSVLDGAGNVITPMTLNTRWFYKYSRGTGAYSEWIRLKPTDKLLPGEGFILKGPGSSDPSADYVFSGTPNSGDYSFDITDKERILLGNPYPSDLNAEQFLKDNIGIIEQLEFWVDGGSTSHILSDYLGGYATFNLTGGATASVPADLISGIGNAAAAAPPTKRMPVAKAFFTDAVGTGKIVFRNSQRFFEEQPLKKPSGLTPWEENEANQYIRLGFEGVEQFHRQLLLGFLPNSPADTNYNGGYDAIQSGTRKDDMFFIIEDDISKRYTIQGVNKFSEEMEFRIGLLISELGISKIMIDELDNFSGKVYIKDHDLNTYHDLTDSNFNVSLPAGEYLDRFSIVFKTSSTLSVNDVALNNIMVYYDGHDQIVVSNADQTAIDSISIYTILGQQLAVVTKNLTGQSKIVIPFKESEGVYMVVVKTETSKKSVKIIKY